MKGWHAKMPTRAVRRRHGAQVALLRYPIPRDGDPIILECVGGLKAINSIQMINSEYGRMHTGRGRCLRQREGVHSTPYG